MSIADLEPQPLWRHFANLNAIPRPSKQEARAIRFIQDYGHSLGLEVYTDPTGNVLIRKPASPGREDRPGVALQSHLDMVHQKNSATDFDFETEGIRMVLDGDWVKAEGTTLGADNGIGVAAIMTILASRELAHPPLEALFTIDEETGMTGAKGWQGGILGSKILLNLDTEDDRELTIGCAGGVDVVGTGDCARESWPAGYEPWVLRVEGLAGGHSGTDIHLGRANANKLMNRLLAQAAELGVRLAELDGGGLRNAIPRESQALVAVPAGSGSGLQELTAALQATLRQENRTTDPDLRLLCRPAETRGDGVLETSFQERLYSVVYALANGIHRLSPEVPGLVQTSNNLARVLVKAGEFSLQCLCRGAVDSEKMDHATGLRRTMELLGAQVSTSGEYPGWVPRPDSGIVKLMSSLYQEMFQDSPMVLACHAGLECGILGRFYPDLEMISFGPNIRGAHSPDEMVQVSSVQKFWRFLVETLARV